MQGPPLLASNPLGINLKNKLMPQYFKDLGYITHLVGKWHVGCHTSQYLPTNRGFDTFFGYQNGFLDYYDGTHSFKNLSGLDAWRNTTKGWKEFYGKYLTTLIAEEAVDVIRRHSATGRNNGLFLVVASPAPHKGNRKLNLEPPPITHGQRMSNISDTNRRIFADVMKALDDTLGEVTVALKEQGMINNSIIVFLSDNGAPTTDYLDHVDNSGSNWPLRGEKMSVHEGGVRTAAAVWASSFNQSSKTYRGLFHITDWLPTLYSAAGGNLSDLIDIDGINQWFTSGIEENFEERKELLVDMEDVANIEAYIKGKWKLLKNYSPDMMEAFTDNYFGTNLRGSIEYNKTEIYFSKVAMSLPGSLLNDSTIERLRQDSTISQICDPQQQLESENTDCHTKYCLYNIEEDPCECYDLAADNVKIVQELVSILEHYRKQLVKQGNRYLDEKGFPGESNYWEPWIFNACSCYMISKLLLLAIVFCSFCDVLCF
ncbi:arylsulfatase B-like isoform X2 [Rhodnius prolixus]